MLNSARAALALLATVAAAVVLAGCGGTSGSDAAAPAGDGPATATDTGTGAGTGSSGGSDASTGSAPDPCSLTTAADLSSAYGVTFGEGAPDDNGPAAQRGFRVCKWTDSGETKSFVLQSVASGGQLGESASDLFDESKSLYSDATDGGVGDKSILLKDDGGFLAVKGDVFVQGNAIIFGSDTPSGATKTVLTAVVGKLP